MLRGLKISKSKYGLHVAQENTKKKSGKTAFYGFLEAEKKDNAKNPIFPQPCHELLKKTPYLKVHNIPICLASSLDTLLSHILPSGKLVQRGK